MIGFQSYVYISGGDLNSYITVVVLSLFCVLQGDGQLITLLVGLQLGI